MMEKPKIGDRVILQVGHPWAGHVGYYVADEEIPQVGKRPKISLDNGTSCFVMYPAQFRKVKG